MATEIVLENVSLSLKQCTTIVKDLRGDPRCISDVVLNPTSKQNEEAYNAAIEAVIEAAIADEMLAVENKDKVCTPIINEDTNSFRIISYSLPMIVTPKCELVEDQFFTDEKIPVNAHVRFYFSTKGDVPRIGASLISVMVLPDNHISGYKLIQRRNFRSWINETEVVRFLSKIFKGGDAYK